jgi:hypothetical protein
MSEEVNRTGPGHDGEIHETIRFMRNRLRMLIVAVWAMTLAVILTITAVLGNLVDFQGFVALTGAGREIAVLGLAGFFALVAGSIALRKNRSCWLWALVGATTFFVGGIAVACVRFLCPKCRRPLTNTEWKDQRCPSCGDLLRLEEDPLRSLKFVSQHLVWFVVALCAMTLALVATVTLVFNNLVDYHAGDPLMYGGSLAGAAALSFLCGWIARRRA